MSQTHITPAQYVTPPSSFAGHPLTPPPTDEKSFTQAQRVIALFRAIQAGKHTKQGPWVEFQLVPGGYDEIERQLGRQKALLGYVKDKISIYDHDAKRHRLVVRTPTASRTIFDGAPLGTKAKHEPDGSFCHTDARYPGVIVEVAYSQTRKTLDRLAEDYLLYSDTGIRVVVGLDIESGKQESRQPTLSVWRTRVEDNEIKVVQEVADEAFRNAQGSFTDHPGLRLQLRDFAYEDLALRELGDIDRGSGTVGNSRKPSIPPRLKKRKRLEIPPDQFSSSDEAKYAEQEERATKTYDAARS
ncbi:hypothetical protein BKA63DRAFT_573496 [Paraphoma chrysanthemicola]|nr:hypothetical protein BKA63DRAFT_573496 [Paraphoma chrysanthemicola]